MEIEETYNEYLLEKIHEIFPKKEIKAYLEANECQRPTVIRTNTLLTRTKDLLFYLTSRKVDCGKIEWMSDAIVAYKSEVPLGATPEYLAGYYMIQGASSMLPVMNLDVGENQKVVDLCAAPGGKSTHIAMLMNNTGVLYCNEICKERIHALKGNLARMGVRNSIISNLDAKDFMVGKMDRVLLDAPCSGTGIICKDPSIKTSKSFGEIKKIVEQQKHLILHAYDMLKGDGIMVYSTCSILVEENENVVNHLLQERKGAKLMEMDIPVGRDGFVSFRGKEFHPSMSRAKRLYPHVHNTDGFFYCKIKKTQ